MGITVDEKSKESDKVNEIVKEAKKVLDKISLEVSLNAAVDPSGNSNAGTSSGWEMHKTFGNEQRLKELEEMLDTDKYKGTRIIGVVGMPGIGKTTLLKEFYKKWKHGFTRRALIDEIRVNVKDLETLVGLSPNLLGELSKSNDNVEDPYSEFFKRKILVVLDDISKREQIVAYLRGPHDWIFEGSRIVIATNDMSLIEGLVHDTYVVRQLNHRDGLQLFRHYAFHDGQANLPNGEFKTLSEEFVHFARGHPRALELLGKDLHGNTIEYWAEKLNLLGLAQNFTSIGSVFQVSYDELSPKQKDAFLEIACFISEDVGYVESLLGSSESGSAETMKNAVKALTDKFLIDTCDGRVEMHNLLYTFSRELSRKASTPGGCRQRTMWLHQDIIEKGVIKTMGDAHARGIFLDLSEVKHVKTFDLDYFKKMVNLRYLKFYNSHCPKECEPKNMINISDGIKLPLKEVRCLHWLKFPETKLPNDFNPINLVDLKLPSSKIEQLWDGVKDTPVLKWVDLNHSSQLKNLLGLSKAKNLQRLNLEECKSLESLPEMNLISLKTLILSGCSKLNEFPFIAENIEALYLERTEITQIPDNVVKFKKLILLNMKDCQSLKTIPTCVGELKALQKLVLSGCSKLLDFPEMKKSSISILLLDGTSIKTMPQLPSVKYLCLSRNDQISCLPDGINQLSQLTWLDLKYCTKLTSVPELPPNLQYFDAHGCTSLKTVTKPLARIMPTMQNHCIINFTNCDNLEQDAKEEITSYAQRKCQLLSDARKHYNEGLSSETLFSTCFPGCEVPSWFCHKVVGSLLQCKLNPHWYAKRLSGISLCAVVSFPNCKDQISSFSVKCTFTIKATDKSWIPFTCPVGSWTLEGVKKDEKIESDHVFIAYITCPHTIRCLDDENSDICNFTEASLEFTVTGATSVKAKFTVLSCGLSLVYAKDKNKNSSHEAKYDIQELQNGMLDLEEQIFLEQLGLLSM